MLPTIVGRSAEGSGMLPTIVGRSAGGLGMLPTIVGKSAEGSGVFPTIVGCLLLRKVGIIGGFANGLAGKIQGIMPLFVIALLNRYRILVFFTCRPFGIVLHPVDVSLAAGGGDADERRARCHALRGYEGFVDDAAPCMVGDYLAGVAVGGGEVRQAHGADIRCAARQREADAGGAVREVERGCAFVVAQKFPATPMWSLWA